MFSFRSLAIHRKLIMSKAGSLATPSMLRPVGLSQVAQRAYHENVIDHYEKPRNVGSLNSKDETVGTGLVGAPACGDVMRLQIKVNKDNNKIEKAVFKVGLNLDC